MDPDAVLQEIREQVAHLLDGDVLGPDDPYTLAERVRALDEWLARGGFLPAAWRFEPR